MSSPIAVHAIQNRIDQAKEMSGTSPSAPVNDINTSSPQTTSSSLPTSKPPSVRPPSRTSELPSPPDNLEISSTNGEKIKYLRIGDTKDSVGKGVFGIVYAYRLDESSSQSTTNDSDQVSSVEDSPREEPSTLRLTAVSTHRPASVVAVKLCKTPQNGVFDELPKTGLCRSLAKTAQKAPESAGFHTRVVRGEKRIVWYLQLVQQVLERKGEGANSGSDYIVKMFDDVDSSGKNKEKVKTAEGETSEDSEDEDEVPTVPNRLLVFESLVELDAPVMRKGSRVKTSSWSMEDVFMTSLEVIQGLKFCHQSNVAHGDLKPSNLMRDPKTGIVKLIDFGASRRFVRIANLDVFNIDAVDELDAAFENGEPSDADQTWCGGLNSLTGSPHFMAPEILMQASKYTDDRGHARSVLHDYSSPENQRLLPPGSEALFDQCCADFDAGWNQQSDIWSWGCTVLSLWLRTRPSFRSASKSSSEATLCPFDFRFSTPTDDALVPLHTPSVADSNLPRFHMWARVFPLRIASITKNMCLPPEALDEIPASLIEVIMGALQHSSTRFTAQRIASSLERLDAKEAASKTRALQKKIDRATSAPNLREKMKGQKARIAPSPLVTAKVRSSPTQSRLAFPRTPMVPDSPRSRGDVSMQSDSLAANDRSNAGSEQAHAQHSAIPQPSYIATQLLTFPPAANRFRHDSSTSISQDESGHSQTSTQTSSHLGEETEATSRGEITQREMEELEELKSINPEEQTLEGSTTQTTAPLQQLHQAIITSPPISPSITTESEAPQAPLTNPPQQVIATQRDVPTPSTKKVVNRPRSESATLMLTSAGKRSPVQLQMHQISLAPAPNAVGSEHLSPTPHRLPRRSKDFNKRKSKINPTGEVHAPSSSSLARTNSRSSTLRKKLLSSPNLKAALRLRRGSQQDDTEASQQDHSPSVQSTLRNENNESSNHSGGSPSTLFLPLQATSSSNLGSVSESPTFNTGGEKTARRPAPRLSRSKSSKFVKRMLSWSGIREEEAPPVPNPPSRSLSIATPNPIHEEPTSSALGLDQGGVDLRPIEAHSQQSHTPNRSLSSNSSATLANEQATVRRRRDRSASHSLSLSSIKSFDAIRKVSIRSSNKRPCLENKSQSVNPSSPSSSPKVK